MRERVIVVGGGVSGLFIGSLVGDGIKIVEEHRVIGLPEHCTGIISDNTLHRMNIPGSFIEASFRRFILYFPGGYRIVLKGSPLAVKINRPDMERGLYYKALDKGAKIVLGTRVDFLTSDGRIIFNNKLDKSELIILAEGYKQYFSRRLGLVKMSERIPAIQVRIKGEVNVDHVEVYFSTLTPRYFSWLVPINGEEAVIGLASKENKLIDRLYLLLRILRKTDRISNYKIKQTYGGLVLRGPLGELTKGKIVAIGDSVGMVKPLTGGGLYPISIAGTILSRLINKYIEGNISLDELKRRYIKEIKYLQRRLKATHQLLNMMNYRIEEFLEVVARGLNILGSKTIIDEVEYDDHLRNILVLLKPKNKVRFLGSIITGLSRIKTTLFL